MPAIAAQSKWEHDVLEYTLDHIKYNDAWSDDNYPLNGVHIQPKPIECKIDVIELNFLTSLLYDDGLKGVININIHHTNTIRIEELTKCVELIMDESYLEGFVFYKDFTKLFRQPHGRWMKNHRYNFKMSRREFRNKYGNKSKD